MDSKDEFQVSHTSKSKIPFTYVVRSKTPWERAFTRAKNYNDIYCLKYESDALMDLGNAFDKFVKNQALRYVGLEVAKQTALRAFFGRSHLALTLFGYAENEKMLIYDLTQLLCPYLLHF